MSKCWYHPPSPQDTGWVLKQPLHAAEQLLTGVISLSLCHLLGTGALQWTWNLHKLTLKYPSRMPKRLENRVNINLSCAMKSRTTSFFLGIQILYYRRFFFPKASFSLCKTKISGRREYILNSKIKILFIYIIYAVEVFINLIDTYLK